MKIMLLVDQLHFGGLENHIALFVNGLLTRSHQVFLQSMSISPYYLAKIKSRDEAFQYFIGENDLLQKAAVFDPDIIHAHPFDSIYRGCKLAGELRKPLIVTIHGLYDHFIDRSPQGYEISRSISRIIAVDQGVVDFLSKRAAEPEKVTIIRNGLDFSHFYPLARTSCKMGIYGLNPDWFTIAYVSRFADEKGLVVFKLLDLAPAIAGELGGLNLMLVGDGPHMPDVKEKSQFLCANHPGLKISMVGMQMDVRPFLAMADLVASCDMAATEAMACSRPVLAAFPKGLYGIINKDNFDDIIYRRCGYVEVLPNNEVVKQIKALAGDKEYWHSLSRESCAIVHDKYKIEDAITRLEEIYYQCIGKSQ
ncbi:MAG: glycosyltransferase family 4 protein [Syntrophomonas sp.]